MNWKKRIGLILSEFTTHQIRLFRRNSDGHLVWSPNIRAPLSRIWWKISRQHEEKMEAFREWKRKCYPKISNHIQDEEGDSSMIKRPCDEKKKIEYLDTRTVIVFVERGMDKCQNLNCLGKIEYGMERCPHCGVRLTWFDEPSPKGWA